MVKANKIFWRVAMLEELSAAESAVDPVLAAFHRGRANDCKRCANEDPAPDVPVGYSI